MEWRALLNLEEILAIFKEYLNYKVPLGVAVLVYIIIVWSFFKIQSNNRKDYREGMNHRNTLISELNTMISERERIISKKEKTIQQLLDSVSSYEGSNTKTRRKH